MTTPQPQPNPAAGGMSIGGIILLLVIGYLAFHGCSSGNGVGGSTKDATITISTVPESVCWSGAIGDSTKDGCGDQTISVHDDLGIFSSNVQNQGLYGTVTISLTVDGEQRDSSTTSAAYGVASVANH